MLSMIVTYTIVGHLGMKTGCKNFSELVKGKKISAVLVSSILMSGLFLGPNLFTETEAGLITTTPLSGGFPCLSEEVTHFDKILFHTEGAGLRNTLSEFLKPLTPLDIKVIDDISDVADLKPKVVNFLTSLGWTFGNGSPIKASFIVIDEVEYAIECIKLQSLQIWNVKYICGVLPITDMPFGLFRTEINIHNPNDNDAFVDFSTSNPPFFTDTIIPPKGDLDIPCNDPMLIDLNGKGFLEISSFNELEIVAVYKNFEFSEVTDMKGYEIFPVGIGALGGAPVRYVAEWSCGSEGSLLPPDMDAFVATLAAGEQARLWNSPALDFDFRVYNPTLAQVNNIGIKDVDFTDIINAADTKNVVFTSGPLTLESMEARNFTCKDLFPPTGIPATASKRADGFIEISHDNAFNLITIWDKVEYSVVITASMDVEYIDPVIRIPITIS